MKKSSLFLGGLISLVLFVFVMILVEEYAKIVHFVLAESVSYVHLIPAPKSKICDCGKICDGKFKCGLKDCPRGKP